MNKVRLGDILKVKTGKYDANHAKPDGIYKFFTCALEATYCNTFSFDDEVLLLPGNGANVGEVFYFDGKFDVYQRTYVLHEINADVKYLYYIFKTNWKQQTLKKQVGSATNYIKIDDILSFEIPLPPIAEQKAIAAKLYKADEIKRLNQQLIEKYDALTQSLFIDMFGDPVKNEMGWEKKKLGELGDFKNGLNYSKTGKGLKLKVLGVGDFKNRWKMFDMSSLSEIDMNSKPNRDFLLQDEDLLYVRSNGNKELVGRCMVVYVGENEVSYSGFCIRFRKKVKSLSVVYLAKLFQRQDFKKEVFKNGRGANIQNINQELLSNIEIQFPPIELQNQFAERVQIIEAQKQLAQEALAKSEALFNSLLQASFG